MNALKHSLKFLINKKTFYLLSYTVNTRIYEHVNFGVQAEFLLVLFYRGLVRNQPEDVLTHNMLLEV